MSNSLFYQQFKPTPLAIALTLALTGLTDCRLVLANTPSSPENSPVQRAANSQPASPLIYPPVEQQPSQSSDSADIELTSARSRDFFANYYVGREAMADLPIDQQRHIAATCRGTWVTPIQASAVPVEPQPASSVVTADYAYYDPQMGAQLSGKVQLDQPGRSLQADSLSLDNQQSIATASGNVQIMQDGLLTHSERALYHLNDQSGTVSNSLYISENQHAHGSAREIARDSNGITRLQNAIYSTCEPEGSLDWKLKAKTIELNENTGRGMTRDTTLYVKDVPVLSLPYFNFPIDERRTSGFLLPNVGYSNQGGARLSVPYYLNLAPNYDATLSPIWLSRRGVLLDGEVRYLTQHAGTGHLNGGFLADDRLYDGDRKSAHWLHDWQITPKWRANMNVNYVSDKDYFTDFNSNPSMLNQLNQQRTLSLSYVDKRNQQPVKNSSEPHIAWQHLPGTFSGLLRVQSFQTIDPATRDIDKPYARLPQLLLGYQGGNPLGLQYSAHHDTAYFKKSIDDGSALESSGTRIFNRLASAYTLGNHWGYARPELSLRTLNTFFDKASIGSQGLIRDDDKQRSVVVPQFSLDSSVVLEKEGHYLQSLTPRLFYAYAPYVNQTGNPNFDTTSASSNFDQLFSPYRFYGNDRLEDNNFASLGLTYRVYDPIGLERFRFAVGQSYYFSDRKVRLKDQDPIATSNDSGIAIAMGSQLSPHFSVNANSLWLSDSENTQNDVQLDYSNQQGSTYHAGYYYRRAVPSQNQQVYEQLGTGFVQALHQQWRVMGYLQYDINNRLAREWLLGVNYEACCFAASLYARRFFNDLDDPTLADTRARRAIMMEISLKGLAGFSGNLNHLLQQKILGYQQVDTLWKER